MSKVLLVSDSEKQNELITETLLRCGVTALVSVEEENIFSCVENGLVDLVIVDAGTKSIDSAILCKKLKAFLHTENLLLLLLVDAENTGYDVMKLANAQILKPVNEKILSATVLSNLKMKKSLDILSKNNSELAKSLYQLDVLYNTSTQLAGSLDKQKLVNIMIDGLEKSLSFSLSSTLIFNDEKNIDLIINSLYGISPRLEHSLKLRAILSYRALFDKKEIPYEINVDDIRVIKNIKHPLEEYDLNILKFDNLFAPINVGEKFFGLIEVFRENEFTQEDTTCFQTLSRQVSLPLENASLYEEIKSTNTKLEKLERLKSEFTSIVSHELRTPLTAIKNSLDILLSGKTGEITAAMDNFLNLAKRNVTRLSGIINDLLDLTKVEAGKMDFRFEKGDINSPVEFVKNTFENLAKEKKIELKLEAQKEIAHTYFDSQRIEQVVTNLVSNAVKFTNENGKIIIKTETIPLEKVDKSKIFDLQNPVFYENYIKVSVADSGIGIAPEDIVKVFDKFQQIENSLNRKNGGTGLGLPIAKQLIEAHRGFIWVESEPNIGTTFSFILPILSEKEFFTIELEKNLQTALNASKPLLLVNIEEEQNAKNSFINEIKSGQVSIIRKTTNTKEVFYEENGKKGLLISIPEGDKFARNFIEKKIETHLGQNATGAEKYDIVYSTALAPEEGKNADELLKAVCKNSIKYRHPELVSGTQGHCDSETGSEEQIINTNHKTGV